MSLAVWGFLLYLSEILQADMQTLFLFTVVLYAVGRWQVLPSPCRLSKMFFIIQDHHRTLPLPTWDDSFGFLCITWMYAGTGSA